MANSIEGLTKPDSNRPIIATIFGEAGLGKTSLGATFPKPVFIRTEDGTQSLAGHDDVALFPVAETVSDVFHQIQELATKDHEFQTVVLDSVTQLAAMIEHEIVEADPKAKSINQAGGGYGAGYGAAAETHGQVRHWMGALAKTKNMNVVFLGHADTESMDLPDADPYSRYTIRLHKKSLPHYIDNVDLVGFLRLETFVRGNDEDRKRAISTNKREVVCHPQAANVSKNRFGITEPLHFELGENPFAAYMKGAK